MSVGPEVVDALWAQMEPVVYITRGQFERGLADWTVTPVCVDERPVYVTLTQGPELHYAKIGDGPPITLTMVRGWMDQVIAQYGYVTTRTPKDDTRQCRLVKRLGAKPVGEDEFFVHFRAEAA